MARFDLTDFEWSVIQPFLPTKVRGLKQVDDRRVLNGIFWRFRTGAPWADIPARYGPYTTCVNRFGRWREAGRSAHTLQAISDTYDGNVRMIDRSSIRARRHGARGGPTGKIHAPVDAPARPIRPMLSAGRACDGHAATDLRAPLPSGREVLADPACDSNAIRAMITERSPAVIPAMPRRNHLIISKKDRIRAERFFYERTPRGDVAVF